MADNNRVETDTNDGEDAGQEHTGSSQTNTPGGAVPGAQGAQSGDAAAAANNGGDAGTNTSGNAGQ